MRVEISAQEADTPSSELLRNIGLHGADSREPLRPRECTSTAQTGAGALDKMEGSGQGQVRSWFLIPYMSIVKRW